MLRIGMHFRPCSHLKILSFEAITNIYSMTFHRGQGGNLGIKDADELVNAMVAVQKRVATLPEAINSYDQGALLRSEEVEISRKCTMAFLDYENFDNSPLFKLGVNPMSKT